MNFLSLPWLNRHRELSSRRNAIQAQPGHDHLPEPPADLRACGAKFVQWLKDSGSQIEFSDMISADCRHDNPARKLANIRKICPDLHIHDSEEDEYEVVFSDEAIALVVPFGGRYRGNKPGVILLALVYLKVDATRKKFSKVHFRFDEEERRTKLGR